MANKKRPLTSEQKLNREKSAFKRKIKSIFTGMGFNYVSTGGHEIFIGHRRVEIDALFIYENIWILCEDTVSKTGIKDHIRTKNEAFGAIKGNLQEFVDIISNEIPESSDIIRLYGPDRILLYGLYIPKYDPDITEDDITLYDNLVFVLPNTLNYFYWIVQAIKRTSINELYRFLAIDETKVGVFSSSSENAQIKAPIIYPRDFTGRRDKVRVVSFMMSAEDLMNSAYVLRKDNWERTIFLYQRLINKEKIRKIRDFIEEKGEAFYNNIIVVLPDDIRIRTEDKVVRDIAEIKDLPDKCELIIPKRKNSICIIDGQHRVFAHYESGLNNSQERKIAQLRKQLHLLVTGLVFDKDIPKSERIKIQSEIFLDINTNASPVHQSVLLQIKRIRDPIGNESLAQLTIEKLNSNGIFKGLFQLSELDVGGIKTASIVRFALKYLVTIEPPEGKKSLFDFWNGNKEDLINGEETAIEEYTTYCSGVLRTYFGAVKNRFAKDWNDPNSKLLSVIAINGFIIALTRQLTINGIRDFDFYNNVFQNWDYSFSKSSFLYTSSQYRKFSKEILKGAFLFSDEVIESI